MHAADLNRLYHVGGALRLRAILRGGGRRCTRTRSRPRTRWRGSRARGRRAGDLAPAHREPLPPRDRAGRCAGLDNATARLARGSSRSPRTRAAPTSGRATRRADRGRPQRRRPRRRPGEREPARGARDPATARRSSARSARLCDVKGQRELIDALAQRARRAARARRRRPRAGRRLPASASSATPSGIGVRDRVVFAGYRADARDAPRRARRARAALLDGGPAARRARGDGAAPAPVVATPVGGTPELVARRRDRPARPAARPATRSRPPCGGCSTTPTCAAGSARRASGARASGSSLDAMCARMLAIYDELAA